MKEELLVVQSREDARIRSAFLPIWYTELLSPGENFMVVTGFLGNPELLTVDEIKRLGDAVHPRMRLPSGRGFHLFDLLESLVLAGSRVELLVGWRKHTNNTVQLGRLKTRRQRLTPEEQGRFLVSEPDFNDAGHTKLLFSQYFRVSGGMNWSVNGLANGDSVEIKFRSGGWAPEMDYVRRQFLPGEGER